MREEFKGVTSVTQYVMLRSSTTGLGITGKIHSDITGSYTRNRAARTAITMTTLASASAAWSSGGFVEVDPTNEPGLYRFDVPDAAFASGVDKVIVFVKLTGAIEEGIEFKLVDWNKQVASIPNAAAESAGGLYTRGTGAGQINQAANGMIDTNPVRLNNVAQSLLDLKDLADEGYDPATNKIAGVVLVDTAAVLSGHTPQTGDAFLRLGAPVGASISVDVAGVQSDTNDIQTRIPAALINGRISSTGAVVSGTADSGSTTTLVDSALTQANDNYWSGHLLVMTSGNLAGQARIITGFVAATDTLTVTPAFTVAVATQDYEIWPIGQVDVESWRNVQPNVLINQRVDSRVGAFGAGVITAPVFGTNAIDETVFSQLAADKIWDALRSASLVPGSFGESLQVIRSGTAQAGAGGTITLDGSASAIDNFYNAMLLQIVAGTGVGQARFISAYVGSTKVASVQGNWLTAPDATSVFVIYPFGTIASVGAIGTGGITSASLATAAKESIADTILDRNMATGTDSGTETFRTVRQALRTLRNAFSYVGNLRTVMKEDDTTPSFTSTSTTDAAADPIVADDPTS